MPILGSQGSQLVRSFLQPLLAAIDSVAKGAGVGQVIVSFTPANSGPAATSFTVTSSPGNITATGASSPLTVTGLTPGTSYTFTVVASNATGNSNASSPSSSIAASQYICSVGTLSGSNCNYAATAYTGYSATNCNACGGGYSIYNSNCFYDGPSYRFECRNSVGSNCLPQCTSYVYYGCPSGGTLSSQTCTIAASIG